MVARKILRTVLLGREVAVAYAALTVLYLMKFIGFQPVQIPAYLMIVAYDVIEGMLPGLTPYYPIGFPLFLYLLAVTGAGIARRLRSSTEAESAWIRTAGGVCLVVGALSVLFGAVVGGPLVSPTDNPTPLAIATATGVVFLVGGWWLMGRLSQRFPVHG